MDRSYNFIEIEEKWRKYWENNPQQNNNDKPKFYCLDMFPYPSSSGLHIGHWRGYVLSDVMTRYKILKGYNVLHPMGWDAFGLPAENYAIKEGIHPSEGIKQSIENFTRQCKEIGTSYNWENEINTTDPEYYKWTQWIFARMYEKGLAYEKEMPLNWCPNCKVVLANEEATNGCDRCGSPTTKKNLRQWMLKITEYADRLLNDLDNLNWPDKVKKMQSEWIGKSYGAEIDFNIKDKDLFIKVYTTRPDTLYGANFLVISPEHDIIKHIVSDEQQEVVEKYCYDASMKSSIDRMSAKEKTGVFTGNFAVNPINNTEIPIWISDYVLADYGTGAIMCVPAHDQRDFEFAKKFGLEITQVIKKQGGNVKPLEKAFEEEGVMVNSGQFNNISSKEAQNLISDYLEEQGIGKKTVNYKLRDWVFSRQRYWGEPIPLIHCPKCGVVVVPDSDLPVMLPKVESYQPTDTGESPLASIYEWVNCKCPKCGIDAKRETNTMPQWAGSSWYFLRFIDPHNKNELASKEMLQKWMPVDYYIGGIEHAVLHLLYARFYTKFLYDIDMIDFEEPFKKLFNQGMLNKNGKKISKSGGNSISPDDFVKKYGTDSLRMYILFTGPPELDAEWDDNGIEGVHRFLNRTWKLLIWNKDKIIHSNKEFDFYRNKIIYDITQRIENLSLNTVISGFMEYTNKLNDLVKKYNGIDKQTIHDYIILLSPFAPHIAEEMWYLIGNESSVFEAEFPKYDESKMKEENMLIVLQLNGKTRDNITVSVETSKEDIENMATEKLSSRIGDKKIIKIIYVPNKLVNIVAK